MCRGATGNGLMSTCMDQPFGLPAGSWSQTTFDSIPTSSVQVNKVKGAGSHDTAEVKVKKEESLYPTVPSQDLEFDFSPFTFAADDVASSSPSMTPAASPSVSKVTLSQLSAPYPVPTSSVSVTKEAARSVGLSGTKRKCSFDDLDFLISDFPDDSGVGSDAEFSYSSEDNINNTSYLPATFSPSQSTQSADTEEYLDSLLLDCLGDNGMSDSETSSAGVLDMGMKPRGESLDLAISGNTYLQEDLNTDLLGVTGSGNILPSLPVVSCVPTPKTVAPTVVSAVLRPGNVNSSTPTSGVGVRSKYKGVRWYKRTNKWVVQIRINGSRKHVGYFADEEEAGRAYAAAMQEAKLTMGKEKKGQDGRRRKRSKQ